MLEPELLDCSWCGSAASIEFGICQICMMEYPVDTKVIDLPERPIDLDPREEIEIAAGD